MWCQGFVRLPVTMVNMHSVLGGHQDSRAFASRMVYRVVKSAFVFTFL